MYMKIMSFSPFGYEGALVTIEVDLRRGIPAVDMVGLADNAVRESRERMRAAIRNSGFEFPVERVLISLSPADVKKEGAGFDLAIALAVLHKKEHPEYGIAKDAALVMGELELSGRIRAVRGVHAALSTAREYGIRNCIIPAENAAEAGVFSSMKVFPVRFLTDAFELFSKLASESEQKDADVGTDCGFTESFDTDTGAHDRTAELPAARSSECANTTDEPVVFSDFPPQADYREISGQGFLIEALQIAAAGRHNLIAYGPPGCGKTLALSRFYTLLPRLTHEEALTVTRIYSIAGLLTSGTQILQDPPFRMPHQSSTAEGIIGGGMHCRPGEISLAHNGVLFLDEAADFRISVLQALRVPLEEGKITLSRAGRSTEYPAHFQLLLAANPCPCGNFGSTDKICLCRPQAVEQYWRRFSAPLLDRIDIRVALIGSGETAKTGEEERDADGFFSAEQRLSTAQLREAIADATAIQRKRQGKPNARLEAAEIRQFCPLGEEAERFLTESARRFAFSARGIHSCIKLARTCADTEKSARIQKHHMEKAVLFHRNAGGIHMMF